MYKEYFFLEDPSSDNILEEQHLNFAYIVRSYGIKKKMKKSRTKIKNVLIYVKFENLKFIWIF